MSVQRTHDGGYQVRWRDAVGVHRAKTFRRGEYKLAKALDEEISRARRLGYLPQLAASQKTVDEVGMEWRKARFGELAPKTQRLYEWLWDGLVRPHLAGVRLAELTPGAIEMWLAELDTGTVAKRKAAALLHQVCNFAVKQGYVIANPVAAADRPKLRENRQRSILSPLDIERIRRDLPDERDRLLVSVMAYGGGMRPQEALALRWEDVQDELVIYAPKTGRMRRARIFEPLRHDLEAWRSKASDDYVFARDDGPWTETRYVSWRRHRWQRVAPPNARPYDCRHTYVSLCLRDPNISRVEAAQWAGHSLQVQDRVYAHVLASGKQDAEEAIRTARAEVEREIMP